MHRSKRRARCRGALDRSCSRCARCGGKGGPLNRAMVGKLQLLPFVVVACPQAISAQ